MTTYYKHTIFYRLTTFLVLAIFLANFLFLSHSYNLVLAQEDNEDLSEVSREIKEKRELIDKLKEEIEIYESNIKTYRKQTISLSNQISILDNQIKKTETQIKLTQNQIDETNLEIQDTENKINKNKENIASQKERLAEFLHTLYRLDQKSYLEVILSNNSFSEFFNQIQTLESVQNEVTKSLEGLKAFKRKLEEYKANLEAKKISLEKLNEELEESKLKLEENKLVKLSIISQTKASESKFQSLVNELKQEQAQINLEIISLEKLIREKLEKEGISKLRALGDVILIWSVKNKGITAYFHDPDYPFRYIFEHPAIDIRASQGTSIRAAASGFVGRVRDGGLGYSYIMLIHNQGISTVYGHVSKIFVKEDDFVTQGEIIGLTGGLPGTPGAGRLSTGPHLHFEVRVNGIPVNPLEYL